MEEADKCPECKVFLLDIDCPACKGSGCDKCDNKGYYEDRGKCPSCGKIVKV